MKTYVSILIIVVMSAAFNMGPARAGQGYPLTVDAAMDRSVLPAGSQQTAYIRINLTGCMPPEPYCRPPVNIAIVIDKSGSMSGEKIENAKRAAIMAIERLSSDDIASVVLYDTGAEVLVPATKLTDKESVCRKIRAVRAGGNTALYDGVRTGADEVRKFISHTRVSRMLLISDGLANVGPSSPEQLGRLGYSLAKDAIPVTTIGLGLGYNEDLMTRLAYNSDGAHYFAERAHELAGIFDRELGKTLSVVAQRIHIEIICRPGVRPVRFLGREGKISGRNVELEINSLYSQSEKYVILEVQVPPFEQGCQQEIASVNVTFDNTRGTDRDTIARAIHAEFSASQADVEKSTNAVVMADVVEQLATEKNELAVKLRDDGQIEKARIILRENADYLRSAGKSYNSQKLNEYGTRNARDAENLDEDKWPASRKQMRYEQSTNRQQE